MHSLILWFFLRLLTSIFAGAVSSIKPIAPLEVKIPFLPPSAPINEWLDRVFLSPWMRWDAVWYQRIVTHGYSATDGTAQFHPLYPWMANPLARMGISPTLSMLIISSLAGIALFYCFNKLALLDLPPKDSFFALNLFAFAPPAFVLFAPYAEALFLLAAVLCMIFIRQKSWWLAGLMGGLAALTRQQGIFLIIPMAWELWENADRKPVTILKQWRDWLALGLIPVGMFIWFAYRAILLNDLHVNYANLQEFIYSFLISPSATKVVQTQQFIWPWRALYLSLLKLFSQPDLDIWVDITTGFLFLILLAISWENIRFSYRLYSLVITWISFSFYTGTVHPYMGLPRHLLLAFPVFVGLSAFNKKQWTRVLIIGSSAAGMLFLLGLYVLNGWVP
jgi:Gpi18-like mannosyltransferase